MDVRVLSNSYKEKKKQVLGARERISSPFCRPYVLHGGVGSTHLGTRRDAVA